MSCPDFIISGQLWLIHRSIQFPFPEAEGLLFPEIKEMKNV